MVRQTWLVVGLVLSWCAHSATAGAPTLQPTERGAIVETDRLRVEFRDGVLVSLHNKLTQEQYLDQSAALKQVLPHLPTGLHTQHGEPARESASKLHNFPWWEHRNDLYLPAQRYADEKSEFKFSTEAQTVTLTYRDLTDGKQRYADEMFSLAIQIDDATGDVLVTPAGSSPRVGVFGSSMSLAPLAPAITAEAPITDGIHISRENTGNVLWAVKWPDYWQYAFVAFNGWKRGAIAIWAQDAELRHYKNLYYIKNEQGVSFSFAMLNVPPFEELKETRAAVPWRIAAFDRSWAQAAERYRAWRDANLNIVPRQSYAQQMSFIASLSGPQENWLQSYLRYVEPYQQRSAAFLTTVRRQGFDKNHADNIPYDGFKNDTAKWRAADTHGMAYLQPMILWGPFPPADKRTEREQQAITLHEQADTRQPFQKDVNARVPHVDQHHLGHPGWQRWFLDWIHEWCKDYGAQGIYHDQSYPAPLDRRGLAIGGMTAPQGMADYFRKAALENPGTFHGTEMVNEANSVAVDNAIGSGYHWGTAPNMRLARAYDSSPVTAALCSPHTVLWSFVRLRGDSTWDLRERRMQEARGQIAGAIDGPFHYEVDPKWWPAMCNTPWHDRTRDVTFLQYGLRPYFPGEYDRNVLSYFRGAKGEEFRYEKSPWGTDFVQVNSDGSKRFIYGVATDVQAAPIAHAGIANWVVYNHDDPSHTWNRTGPAGLHPDRWYVLDPSINIPAVHFSTNNGYGPSFYESYVSDSASNEYFTCLSLRTIERLTAVSGAENLTLHSPTPPLAVYVNGRLTKVTAKPDVPDQYALSVQIPADIIVIHKQPPAELVNWHEAALLRVTESGAPVDYYRPQALLAQANGGVDEKQRPIIADAAVGPMGFQFGGRKQILLPITAPSESRGGTLRVHLPYFADKNNRKWNQFIESVELNGQRVAWSDRARPVAGAAVGNATIPDVIEIALKPGEIKLLSVRTLPFIHGTFTDMKRTTTRVALEWVEPVAKSN